MSFTSTTDTLATPLVSPSSSRESNRGQTQLRRRMHSLGIPTSVPLNGSVSAPGEPQHAGSVSVQSETFIQAYADISDRGIEKFDGFPVSDGQSEPDSSEDVHIGASSKLGAPNGKNASPKRDRSVPKINTTQSYVSYSPIDNMSPNSRSWYEFDLSVVVALVSPIGNWLTGGDHVKHLLLILLLIFYLHQIIEIPWALYHKARPRRRPQPHDSPLEPHSIQASSELRVLELLFLVLTVTSPLLGSLFLHYIVTLVAGRDTLSWFSTALFVLATGIRPWRHLVERVSERTKDLHDAIHYPPTPSNMESKIDDMLERIIQLETSLASVRTKFASTTDELYDYVDDGVESIEIACRKHDKKFEKQDARVKDIEEAVTALKKSKDLEKKLSVKTHAASQPSALLMSILPSWLGLGLLSPPRTPTRVRHSPSSSTSKHSLRTYPSNSSIRLESIPEEDTKPAPPPSQSSSSFRLRIPGAPLVFRWGDLATLPLRRVVHYLLT